MESVSSKTGREHSSNILGWVKIIHAIITWFQSFVCVRSVEFKWKKKEYFCSWKGIWWSVGILCDILHMKKDDL